MAELTPEEKKAAAAAKREAALAAKKAAVEAATEENQQTGAAPADPAEPEIQDTPADQDEPAGSETPADPAEPAAPEAPADPEEETPPSPATSFSQSPGELQERQQQAEEHSQDTNDSTLAGALAAIADPDSAAGKLHTKGREILDAHATEPAVWMTADGLAFFRECDARNHAADKKDKTVLTVTRD